MCVYGNISTWHPIQGELKWLNGYISNLYGLGMNKTTSGLCHNYTFTKVKCDSGATSLMEGIILCMNTQTVSSSGLRVGLSQNLLKKHKRALLLFSMARELKYVLYISIFGFYTYMFVICTVHVYLLCTWFVCTI